jgi:predicted nucleic acid-binding protein
MDRQGEMIYLDTSCLLKLLLEEPESADVRRAVDAEDEVLVSTLAELEAEVHLKGAAVGGQVRTSQWRQYHAKLSALRNFDPFHFRHLPAAVFSTALRQQRHSRATYCRSLDRLHLAAMEELKVLRLMTLDKLQARVATELDYEVVRPGRK